MDLTQDIDLVEDSVVGEEVGVVIEVECQMAMEEEEGATMAETEVSIIIRFDKSAAKKVDFVEGLPNKTLNFDFLVFQQKGMNAKKIVMDNYETAYTGFSIARMHIFWYIVLCIYANSCILIKTWIFIFLLKFNAVIMKNIEIPKSSGYIVIPTRPPSSLAKVSSPNKL